MDSVSLALPVGREALWALGMVLACLGSAGIGLALFGRLLKGDPALRFGLAGLSGLGACGLGSLLVGLFPGGASVAAWCFLAASVAGLVALARRRGEFRFGAPSGGASAAAAVLALCGVFVAIALLAPSTAQDWDSLAYHMALPKLYLAAGHVFRVRTISHSNFPEAVELLFLLPLKFGSQAGAKAVLASFGAFGGFALFGLARERYGAAAGWWTAVSFATAPIVLWESATAYIDVAHGLYAGLAVCLALSAALGGPARWTLAGLLLGMACGTKYTGLETGGVLLVFLVYFLARKVPAVSLKHIGIVFGVAAAIGGPWYVKNIVEVGNPVYPFAYEQFGGKDWNEPRAQIYRTEQLSFGVGPTPAGLDWRRLGAAVLGLAYQPGRYVNPAQAIGAGSPFGAVGLAFVGGLLFWAVARRPGAEEGALLAFAGVSVLLWFALSQQSRYLTALMPPAFVLFGAAAVSGALGRLAGLAAALQAGTSFWLDKTLALDPDLPEVAGKFSPDDWLDANLAFAKPARAINELPGPAKVALYDQVFGFYLDKPYVWANPGHSTLIPYDGMKTGLDYVRALRALGVTEVYVQFVDRRTDPAFAAAIGAEGRPVPLPAELESRWRGDWTQAWKPLLADAASRGEAVPELAFPGGILLALPGPAG